MPETAGELVASSGEVMGRHEGISNFTVGQEGAGRELTLAALRAEYRSGEPPRDGGRRCGTGHAHAARAAAELDLDSGADGANAGAGEDSASA
jgi:hypothetical protein